ncbi:hypothetical protein Pmani_011516 [Petrolisthes manimaculis]|uniref:4-coumarate--CoA ligase n=1 Tax=Petrolisthes manimaculis TaxID=1843537 RepID=A0AAE1Q2T3_9EUCA|nr:hypothetical protein Pmani_011516 [Petrolisthes manimaculis]
MKGLHLLTRGQVVGKARWPAVLQTTRKARLVASRAATTTINLGQEATPSYEEKYDNKTSADYNIYSTQSPVQPHTLNVYYKTLEAAARWPLRTVAECGITGRQLTFSTLQDQCVRFSGLLQRGPGRGVKGVGNGDVVNMFITNCPEYLTVFYGIIGSGAIPSPVNSAFTPDELARQLLDSGSKVIATETLLEPVVTAAIKNMKNPPFVYVVGKSNAGHAELLPILQDNNTPFDIDPQIEPDEFVGMVYSSGTTGLPKGVLLSHKSLNASLPAYEHPEINFDLPCTDEHQTTVMGLLPFFHAYGSYMGLLSGPSSGCKIVTLPKFDPQTYLSAIKKHKFRHLHIVPPLLSFLCHPTVTSSDLSCLQGVTCSAAPCPIPHVNILKDKTQHDLFFQDLYGMTETMVVMTTPVGQERLGSCGKLLYGSQARVVHMETQDTLPPDSKGELWIKTDGGMTGYHNNPEATKQTKTSDGWIKTGDVAKYDDQGYFYIVDRIKELIKVKGLQVSPTEIEKQLMKHDAVLEAGVVGVTCERAGEVPKAYVVKKKDVSEKELQTFIAKHMAKHKQLKGGVEFIDALPKNPAGKLLRRVLQERGM